MTYVLITGGAGFIGSSLAEKLIATRSYFVVCADNLLTGDSAKIPVGPNIKFIACDINRYEQIAAIMDSYHFDYVFHYAAVVGVKRTIENPVMVLEDIQGIKNILDLCRRKQIKRLFYASSSEVYGEPVELPQHEDTTPLNSRLPYAVVKNIGESFCRAYQKEFGLSYTIFRFFNTYGPKQSVDFVISKFIRSAISHEPITIYGNGQQSRTFCYISDNVDCVVRILQEELMVNDIINIGSETEVSVSELAKLIIRITGSRSVLESLPPLKEGDMTRRQPDASKMMKILDRKLIPLEEGISLILDSPNYILGPAGSLVK